MNKKHLHTDMFFFMLKL